MNVREKAKSFEAFMSKSSSMEREKKRSREETIEIPGSAVGDKKKMAEGGKIKPVPPPRKKKVPERPERSPQVQLRSTITVQVKNSSEVQAKPAPLKTPPSSESEKPKTPKRPPPRPAPYQPHSSPSLTAKPRSVPKRSTPITKPTPTTTSPETQKKSTKAETPKRPPPPSKMSSLPRKPKPPLPPKPLSRIAKPAFGEEKEKSATLPKTGSLKAKERKSEEDVHLETKAERSQTGPHRISMEKEDKAEEIQDNLCVVKNGTKDMSEEDKETSNFLTLEQQENVIKQTTESTPKSEEKEMQVEIPNGVFQEDQQSRTLNNKNFKDEQPETGLKEEILDASNAKLEIDKDISCAEILNRDNLSDLSEKDSIKPNDGNERVLDVQEKCEEEDVADEKNDDYKGIEAADDSKEPMNDDIERVTDAQEKDERKDEVATEANEPPQFVSLKSINKSVSDSHIGEETPLDYRDLSMEIEEKTVESQEEIEIALETSKGIANSLCKDNGLENSLSLASTTVSPPQEVPMEQTTPVDMVVGDEEKCEQINETEDNSSFPTADSNVCKDVDVIEKPVEPVPLEEEENIQPSNKSEFHTSDIFTLSEDATVLEEEPVEQEGSEVMASVEEESDVRDALEIQQEETEAILEAIAMESEEPLDKVNNILNEKDKEEVLETEINATEQNEGWEYKITESNERDDGIEEEESIDSQQQNEEELTGLKEKSVDQNELATEVEDVLVKPKECNERDGIEKEDTLDTQQQSMEELSKLHEEDLDQRQAPTKDEDVIEEAPIGEMFRGQTDYIQTDMEVTQEEATTEADDRVLVSSEENILIDTESEDISVPEDISEAENTEIDIEEQARLEENGENVEKEITTSVSQNQEIISSKTEDDNVGAVQKKQFFDLDDPIKPRRPSRLKKLAKNNIDKNSEVSKLKDETIAETQVKENCKEEQPQSKSVTPYENVVLDVSSTEESKVSDSLSAQSHDSVPPKPSSGYENVILRTEDKSLENKSPGTYEVPRPSSFHSHMSEEKTVRTRSSSIGSLERKPESEYRVPKPRSKTVTEDTYVVPRSNVPVATSLKTEETYVVPGAFRASPTDTSPISESEYHVPKSLVRDESTEAEYKVPSRTRFTNGSDAEEGVYSVPSSPITVTRATRMGQLSGSVEEEGVYSVPKSSTSVPKGTHVETERVRQTSECEDEGVYSVPKAPSANEAKPSSDPTYPEQVFRRSNRSSVITSRDQLPASSKHAPPKPARASIDTKTKNEETQQQTGDSKPIPIPRTVAGPETQSPDFKPRVVPQPKPRRVQADTSIEKKEDELSIPSPPTDQLLSSPKPKRPAPPRPKVPAVSPVVDKKNVIAVTSEEKKQPAPPRPPPPSANRTSFAPSEPESISSIHGFQSGSSESESEEEEEGEAKPTESTGPPKKKTYHIAHEILSTEKTFVNALTLCYEDCYGLIRKAEVVSEATLNDIFKDLGNIYQLDCEFLQELDERMKTWDEHERIGDIVKKYGHFLKMYTTYINNYDKAMNVLQETTKENLQFAELVQQFQASEKCKGLFLISFMLKPVQRIPSYRLLLKDYLKHLPPDSDEFKDIQVALEIVSEVATHINESMKKADNFERVLRIQESLVGNAEIVKPGRDLIKEGVLKKLCRKDMQERMFFLLTDVLLYTAPVGNTQYKLKEKLPLLGMKVTLPESPDFENEFSIISKMRSFTLSASTPAERDAWIRELNNAINAMTDKKKTFLKSKDGAAINPEEEKESQLGEKAPVWIPDARVTMCMLCTDNFTVTNRRHHCRGCGKVVCGSCSDNLAPLAYLDYEQARVCEVCYDFLLKEQNKVDSTSDLERLPVTHLGMNSEELDRIHRKPPKFEILHRFKSSNRAHNKRKSKAFGRPSVCTEVVGHESGSQMSGYLKFKRSNKHGWKRLWFVLKGNVLYTYKASEDVVAIETIPILGYSVQEATRTEDEIQFQLKHAGLPPITFKTESESSVSRWIQELKKATTL